MSIDEKTIKAALLKGERVTLECKTAQTNVLRMCGGAIRLSQTHTAG